MKALFRDSDRIVVYATTEPQEALLRGGLVEFYRSPARVAWTPTGTNVPDYPKLANLFWQNVALAVSGEKTPQEAMDTLASDMDKVLGRLQRAGMNQCAPKLNKPEEASYWYSKGTAPAFLGRNDRAGLGDAEAGHLSGGAARAERYRVIVRLRCDPALDAVLACPMPARQVLPAWLETMPMLAGSEMHGGGAIRTVKQCPPFVDAMRAGFVIPLPCDVQ